jgi:hypothetical protein
MRLGVLNKCPSSFIPASDRIVIIKIRPPKIKTHAPCIITTTTTTITRTISDQIALRERYPDRIDKGSKKEERGLYTPSVPSLT